MDHHKLDKHKDFKCRRLWFEVLLDFFEFSLTDNDCDGFGVDHVHKELERITRESPDARKGTTNVKAKMTKWNMLEHTPFKIVANKVQSIIEDYYQQNTDLDLETFMTTCWGSIYSKGDYSELHAHVPAMYSWVYYVKVDENSAPLHFPRKLIGPIKEESFGWRDNSPDSGFYYRPKSGTGIIFPGWFEHQVPPHTGDTERIIVVGNVDGAGMVQYPQKQRKFTIVEG